MTGNERAIKRACMLIMEREIKYYDELIIDTPHVFSKRFEENMEKLINHSNRKHIKLRGKRIIALVAAVLILIGIFTMSVGAKPIVEWILTLVEDDRGAVVVPEIDIDIEAPTLIEVIYLPEYIPSDFVIENKYSHSVRNRIIYENSEGKYIDYVQSTLTGSRSTIDAEDVAITEIQINNFNGLYVCADKYIGLIWTDGYYLYKLYADASGITKEELVKIAESLKEVKK